MNTSKALRVGGFTLAVGLTASLVGFAAHSTGAYFTGSTPGTIQGQTGHVKISGQNTNLDFTNLNPGEDQTKTVTYTTDSTTKANDIWLSFPLDDSYKYFTGNSQDSVGGGLGRYGHFAVENDAGKVLFSSYNLADTDATDQTSGCANSVGHGIGRQATGVNDTPPFCGVPHYILIDSNVPAGATRHLTITFGVTGRQTQQGQLAPPRTVDYQVVATQVGIAPNADNF